MKNQFELVIEADENDADYVTSTNEVSTQDIVDLEPIIKVIKGKRHNWENGERGNPWKKYKEILTKKQIDWFEDLIPHSEYGIHTIISIVYYPIPNKIKLL